MRMIGPPVVTNGVIASPRSKCRQHAEERHEADERAISSMWMSAKQVIRDRIRADETSNRSLGPWLLAATFQNRCCD